MTHFINKSKLTEKFSTIPNALIQNFVVSLEARGLLVYLLSLPLDWKLNIKDLSKKNNMGENKIRKLVNELIQCKYIVRVQDRVRNGTFKSFDYFIYDTPQTLIMRPVDDLPHVDIPQVDNPLVDIGETYKRNNIQNKKYTKEIYTDSFKKFWEKYPQGNWNKINTFRRYKQIKDQNKVLHCLINYCETKNVKNGFIHNPSNFLKDNFYLQFDFKTEEPSEEKIRESRFAKYKLNMQLDDSAINDLKKYGYINKDGSINEKKIEKK